MRQDVQVLTCLERKSLLIPRECAIKVRQQRCNALLPIHYVQLPIRLLVHPYLTVENILQATPIENIEFCCPSAKLWKVGCRDQRWSTRAVAGTYLTKG